MSMNEKEWFKQQLVLLVSLQKYYLDYFSIENHKKRILDFKDDKLKKNLELSNKLKSKKEKLDYFKKNLKDKDLELKNLEQRIKNLESNERNIKTQKEYNTMNTERLGLEEMIRDFKEELKTGNRKLIELELDFSETEVLLEEEKRSLEAYLKEFETKALAMDENLERLDNLKKNLLEKIDRRILDRFNFIIKSKKDSAVVPIIDEVCQGCNVIIGPMVFTKALKSEDFVFCNNCSRILYFPHYIDKLLVVSKLK